MFLFLSSSIFAETIDSTAKGISRLEILEKLAAINSVYYEATSLMSSNPLMPGGEAISEEKIWFKDGYLRRDTYAEQANAKERIVISTPEASYVYNSFSDEIVVKKMKKEERESPSRYERMLFYFLIGMLEKQKSVDILGTEEVDGKITTIIEYVASAAKLKGKDRDIEKPEQKIKAWIWNEKGVPLKHEIKWQDIKFPVKYTNIIEYKNYSFDEIPAEIFEVLKK